MLLSYTVDTRTFILQRAFFLGSQMSRVEIKIDWLVDWFIDWLDFTDLTYAILRQMKNLGVEDAALMKTVR